MSIAIEKKIESFWWKNYESKYGIHWKNWETLKKRKDEGGMGFRDLLIFNRARAMLGKQAWLLAQDQTPLWCRTLKGLYFQYNRYGNQTKEQGPLGDGKVFWLGENISNSV